MKNHYLLRSASLLVAFCAITTNLGAVEIEPSLKPLYNNVSGDRPFTAPLEGVSIIFDRCIKLFDDASVTVMCDGKVVATAVSLEIKNYESEKVKQGVLLANFDKQNLPKGKTYSLCLSQGSVGWVECYNNIQVVNMAYSSDFEVPENLGEAHSEISYDSAVENSDRNALGIYYRYEIAPIGTPKFKFYRENELIDEVPAYVSWDWDLGSVSPEFPEKINFDFGVRYSLTLPAGSVSTLLRDDIVNEEYTLSFIGCYKEEDAPFSYAWCSLFNEHSDILDMVSFTYGSPVGVTEGAEIELYEGDCETFLKSVPAYLNTDVNCWLVCCDFGGFKMTSEKGYTVVMPDDAVYLQQFPDIKSTGGKVRVFGSSIVSDITAEQNENAIIYDMMGRVVANPIPGSIYIKNGRKFIYKL